MPNYVFHLYVTGHSPRSLRAEANLRRMCEQCLGTDYELAVIDVQARPDLAEAARIFATPATIRVTPPPPYKVIGDLSDSYKVATALGIDENGTDSSSKEELK
jgi:circadian clock protein KaiB